LVLVSAKTSLHFLNSSYGGSERHVVLEKRPAVALHPDDAEARGIADGDVVRVFKGVGSVELRAAVDGFVRPGVVAMPHGWWGELSANNLTSDGLADVGGGADFYSTRVEVARP
jgi:anaerobic selenocysteine-containing dehydrogenase